MTERLNRKKRSVSLHGHRTSIALEPEFWTVIEEAAKTRKQSLASLITEIDDERILSKTRAGLASYLRVWALRQVQSRS